MGVPYSTFYICTESHHGNLEAGSIRTEPFHFRVLSFKKIGNVFYHAECLLEAESIILLQEVV